MAVKDLQKIKIVKSVAKIKKNYDKTTQSSCCKGLGKNKYSHNNTRLHHQKTSIKYENLMSNGLGSFSVYSCVEAHQNQIRVMLGNANTPSLHAWECSDFMFPFNQQGGKWTQQKISCQILLKIFINKKVETIR